MSELSPLVFNALHQTFDLARSAVRNGNHPFGAVLLFKGEVVAQAENSVQIENDVTRHAELNLISQVTRRFSRDELRESILVSSTEPCAMCAGAIYWAGVGQVVYGCSAEQLESIAQGGWASSMRVLYASAQRAPQVSGPHLEREAAQIHRDFW